MVSSLGHFAMSGSGIQPERSSQVKSTMMPSSLLSRGLTGDVFQSASSDALSTRPVFGQQQKPTVVEVLQNVPRPIYWLMLALLAFPLLLRLGGQPDANERLPVSTEQAEGARAVLTGIDTSRFPRFINQHLSLPFKTVQQDGSLYQMSQTTGYSVEELESFNRVSSRTVYNDTRIFLPYLEFKVGSFSDESGNVTGVGHLSGIASITNVSPRAIAVSNRINMDDPLSRGQTLRIPVKAVDPGSPDEDRALTELLLAMFPDLQSRNIAFTIDQDAMMVTGSADAIPVNMDRLDMQELDQEQRLFTLDPRITDHNKKKRPRR